MKPSIVLLFLLLLAGCTRRNIHESSEKDSVAGEDSATGQYGGELSENEYGDDDESSSDSLVFLLETAVDDIANRSAEAAKFTLNASFNSPETQSESTYYFDGQFALVYAVVNWSQEYTSGSYSYYFKGDSLVAGREENGYNDYEERVIFHAGLRPALGYSRTNGTEDDSRPTYLYEADYLSRNSAATEHFERVISRIREYNTSATYEGDFAIVHVETAGEDFTETEDFRISRPLFNSIVGE